MIIFRRILATFRSMLGEQSITSGGLAATVRTKGIMICTLVSPISLRTLFIAAHSSSKHGRKLSGDIASGAPEAEHRILFVRFVLLTTDQIRVLVRFEVRHA